MQTLASNCEWGEAESRECVPLRKYHAAVSPRRAEWLRMVRAKSGVVRTGGIDLERHGGLVRYRDRNWIRSAGRIGCGGGEGGAPSTRVVAVGRGTGRGTARYRPLEYCSWGTAKLYRSLPGGSPPPARGGNGSGARLLSHSIVMMPVTSSSGRPRTSSSEPKRVPDGRSHGIGHTHGCHAGDPLGGCGSPSPPSHAASPSW